MSVHYDKDAGLITLHTENTTYQMKVGRYGHLLHLYYGERSAGDFSYLLTFRDRGFSGNPYDAGKDRTYSMDTLPQEFSSFGNGDHRRPSCLARQADGAYGLDLRFKDLKICPGKKALDLLPTLHGEEDVAQTLRVRLLDEAVGLEAELVYGVFPEYDIITRRVELKNTGKVPIYADRADSMSMDLAPGEEDFIYFAGRYGTERLFHRQRLLQGRFQTDSSRGESSHQANPFIILGESGMDEKKGFGMGAGLLWSGCFEAGAEKDQFGGTRAYMGLASEMTSIRILPGEGFVFPEAAFTFAEGFEGISRRMHRMVRDLLTDQSKIKARQDTILLNSWEGCYFDFDGKKIIALAEEAAALGINTLVMDDGWFGKRDSDESGLGDWQPNEKKLGMSLKELAKEVRKRGLSFGIWIEPEMCSEDSGLYRAHPDFAFTIPGKKPVRSRYQLVLDFSRKEVVDYVLSEIITALEPAAPEYIKMDMNRSVHEVYTWAAGTSQNRGEILYKYVLGVYYFIKKLKEAFPDALVEGCSGGGGRFDYGMLYYVPQIWLSDNTDAVERLAIQHGSSFGYPVCCMGSHISRVPNEQTGRCAPISARMVAAMSGSFGYELILSGLSAEEAGDVKKEISFVKKYRDLVQTGEYFRLNHPAGVLGAGDAGSYGRSDRNQDQDFCAWEFAKKDGSLALVCLVTVSIHCNDPVHYVFPRGLKPDAVYDIDIEYAGEELLRWIPDRHIARAYGSQLLSSGFVLPFMPGEYNGIVIAVREVG